MDGALFLKDGRDVDYSGDLRIRSVKRLCPLKNCLTLVLWYGKPKESISLAIINLNFK